MGDVKAKRKASDVLEEIKRGVARGRTFHEQADLNRAYMGTNILDSPIGEVSRW